MRVREREKETEGESEKEKREKEVIMHGPIKNPATTFQNLSLDKVVNTEKIYVLKSYIIL